MKNIYYLSESEIHSCFLNFHMQIQITQNNEIPMQKAWFKDFWNSKTTKC